MSTLKVNAIKRYTGTTITIGESGDTITITSGATLSGSGASLTALDAGNISAGTLVTGRGGTGSTSTTYCDLTANVTGTLPTGKGGTGSTSTTYASLTANVSGTLPVGNGGTNLTSYAVGDILYASGTTTLSKLAKPGTPADEVLTFATGASAPSWVESAGGISWQSVQTSTPFTAVAGNGYPINTTSGAITMNLPAGVVGEQVGVVDYAGTFDSNALSISANGSENIKGATDNVEMSTERQAGTLTYVDATQGWVLTSAAPDPGMAVNPYIVATGGTITTVATDYKVHTFLSSGTFTVTNGGAVSGSNQVEVLVVGGGGSGGGDVGGGGGGGGIVEGTITQAVTSTDYTITVGAAGSGVTGQGGNDGGDSYFANGAASTYECIANGGGRGGDEGQTAGNAGGSGGGAHGTASGGAASGSTAATGTTARGYAGGNNTTGNASSGGGGAAGAGEGVGATTGGYGGAGFQDNIDGNNYYWSGGGGGASWSSGGQAGAGGIGGGGGGSAYYTSCAGGSGGAGGGSAINNGGAGRGDDDDHSGTGGVNSGGGGGGAGNYWGACSMQSGNGGSGIVIIRYKFQN